MEDEELHQLIKGCIKQDRKCQKMLYKEFYGFSMGICVRYTNDRSEAADVMNHGYFKVFTKINRFDIARSFKTWIGKIMVNACIDYYRLNLKTSFTEELEKAEHIKDNDLTEKDLSYNNLLAMVQRLPLAYRTVFNLFAIDGYSHEEIGKMLNINSGTSKSNLHKAREKLTQMAGNFNFINESFVEFGDGLNYAP